jgi:SNF2 family DNA or RNA helicase
MSIKTKDIFPREPENSLAAEIKTLTKEELQEALHDVLPLLKTQGFIHQLATLTVGISEPAFLFALDMGAGKCKISIDIATVRRHFGDVQTVLVTAPPIALHHWGEEIKKHSNNTVTIVDGTPSEKFQLFCGAQTDYIVVSHPWLVRLFSEIEKGEVDETLVRAAIARFDMLVIDEAHRLKSADSKGFAGYAEFFSKIPFVYELTGTPVGNNFLGLWAIYYLLDKGETFTSSYNRFITKWFDTILIEKYNPKTRRVNRIPIYRLNKAKKEDFFARFWTRAIRYEESELTDLPEKNYEVISVKMTLSQRKEYAAVLQQALITSDDPVYDLMRITGGATNTLRTGRQLPAKLEALEAIIEDICIEKGDQLIVWCHLVDEGRAIAEFISKKFKTLNFGEIRAEISKTQKDKYIAGWKKGTIQILIANAASLGIAVDLFEANVDVFYSNGRSLIDRKQAEKRIHRQGQKKPCFHIDLVCEGTVDELILEGLNNAQEAFAGLTRDQMWTKIKKKFK